MPLTASGEAPRKPGQGLAVDGTAGLLEGADGGEQIVTGSRIGGVAVRGQPWAVEGVGAGPYHGGAGSDSQEQAGDCVPALSLPDQ